MNEAVIAARARELGLDKALEHARADVIAAARRAEAQRRDLAAALRPDEEPWPPMRADGQP